MHPIKRLTPLRGGIITVTIVLLLLALFFLVREDQQPAPVVVSKGSRLLEDSASWETAVYQARARELALADEGVGAILSGKDFGFLFAHPLSSTESQQWSAGGCADGACARASFYDYSDGGTVDAIVNLDTGMVVKSTVNREARPGASAQVVPRAMALAAADSRVTDVLGDVRKAEPSMGPMAGWLMDDDCSEDWCVDLTFAAPDGSGRTFHVFVNMEQEEVARVFYSRSRFMRAGAPPAERDRTWNNDCHEQYGWSVCWEMTAHDGVEFRDATFNGDSIFSNVKIGQVEVFYPSWPGGYRDEVGYAASVQPADGTPVTDLGDGFEVRQLFTEFMVWPNCVCCYRYEQVLRFYDDGALDLQFISHGPGCDDPMFYRPFWRIDLDLDGPENEELLLWEDDRWEEVKTETSQPLFKSLSPDGELLITGGGKHRYRWLPLPTDPLGADDGRLFLLRWNEDEGEGEIVAGPADSFRPPGQWVDGETLPGENIVIWYIPILHGRKSEPYWCMPEPDPDFSPCDAEMRIEPFDETAPAPKATAELVAPVEPSTPGTTTATPARTVESTKVPTASPTTIPLAEQSPAPTRTPRPVAGDTPEELAGNGGCTNCHLIGDIGEAGKVGPDLSSIGILAGQRVPGQSASEYLRTSIIDPTAYIASECPNGPCFEGIMPGNYDSMLTDGQIDTLVDFLLEQKAPISNASEAGTEPSASEAMSPAAVTPIIIISLLLLVVIVLVFLRLPNKKGDS